jgi:chemotaxis protein CheZ
MDLMQDPDSLRSNIRDDVGGMVDELRRFVDRRIAELSMEISATVQLVDFSETNLSGQLARIQEQMASVLAVPNQQARNSGLELEAVVQVTETAANQIMEAAEAIDNWLREGTRDADGLQAVSDRINAIFEACSFQDLTSQRIRRAIAHLQQVDDMLAGIASGAKPAEPSTPAPGIMPVGGSGADLAQDDIDSLFD